MSTPVAAAAHPSAPAVNTPSTQFTTEFLEATRKLEQDWRQKFSAIAQKFGVDPSTYARHTDSGLPLKPAYFPHDVATVDFQSIGAPGIFPFTRGLYAAQYQFMPWANQPVIGYGLPEETRRRIHEVRRLTDAIAAACGRPAENVHLVYAPAGRGRVAFGGRLRT